VAPGRGSLIVGDENDRRLTSPAVDEAVGIDQSQLASGKRGIAEFPPILERILERRAIELCRPPVRRLVDDEIVHPADVNAVGLGVNGTGMLTIQAGGTLADS